MIPAPPVRRWARLVEELVAPEEMDAFARDLARLLGPPPRQDKGRRGTPDGYAGVGRRGPVERLLPATWALSEVARLEFLRRLTQGELLYHQLEHRQPAHSRRVTLLFDVGPEQLGAPRLAQLALWIAVASKAEEREEELVVGLLQEPGSALPGGLTRGGVRRWHQGRTRRRVTAEDAERAVRRCGPWTAGDRLLWASPAPVPPSVRSTLEEAGAQLVRVVLTDGEGTSVHVRVEQGGRRATRVLEGPPLEVAVRLLRDPLERRATRRFRTPEPELEELVWAPSGRRLMVRSRGGVWAAIAVPSGGRQQDRPATVQVPMPEGKLLAVGWARGQAMAWGRSDAGWLDPEGGRVVPAPDVRGVGVVLHYRGAVGTWFEVGGRVFRRVDGEVVELGVGQLWGWRGSVQALLWVDGVWQLDTWTPAGVRTEGPRDEGSKAFLHGSRLAVQRRGRVRHVDGTWRYDVGDDEEVLGVVTRWKDGSVVTWRSNQMVVVKGEEAPAVLGKAEVRPVMSPKGLLAYLEEGQLVVHDLGDAERPIRQPVIRAPARLP